MAKKENANVSEAIVEMQNDAVQNIVEREEQNYLRENFSRSQRTLLRRFEIILEHIAINETVLDRFEHMIHCTRGELNERELQRIDEEIARLTAKKQSLL